MTQTFVTVQFRGLTHQTTKTNTSSHFPPMTCSHDIFGFTCPGFSDICIWNFCCHHYRLLWRRLDLDLQRSQLWKLTYSSEFNSSISFQTVTMDDLQNTLYTVHRGYFFHRKSNQKLFTLRSVYYPTLLSTTLSLEIDVAVQVFNCKCSKQDAARTLSLSQTPVSASLQTSLNLDVRPPGDSASPLVSLSSCMYGFLVFSPSVWMVCLKFV